MAKNTKLTNLAVTALATGGPVAFASLFDNGYIRIYDGAQPANADDAVTTQVLLAELRWNATAFSESNGVLTPNPITSDSSANNSGTAAWYRALKADGTTKIMDGSVGVGTFDLSVVSTTITAGQIVSISGGTVTVPKS